MVLWLDLFIYFSVIYFLNKLAPVRFPGCKSWANWAPLKTGPHPDHLGTGKALVSSWGPEYSRRTGLDTSNASPCGLRLHNELFLKACFSKSNHEGSSFPTGACLRVLGSCFFFACLFCFVENYNIKEKAKPNTCIEVAECLLSKSALCRAESLPMELGKKNIRSKRLIDGIARDEFTFN